MQDELERSNNVTTPTPTPKPKTQPEPPKAPVSVFASLSLGLLILGFVLLMAGTVFSLPYLLALGGFDALAAITLAVLSLREKQ